MTDDTSSAPMPPAAAGDSSHAAQPDAAHNGAAPSAASTNGRRPQDDAGHPLPRQPDSTVVVGFAGSLSDLLRLCRRVATGTIVDLAGDNVHASASDNAELNHIWSSEPLPAVSETVPLFASIANTKADLLRVGLNSLRLARDELSDAKGGVRGPSALPRPPWAAGAQSPQSLTIAGAPEPYGGGWKVWSLRGSSDSTSVGWGEETPTGAAASDPVAGDLTSALRIDSVDRVPWHSAASRAMHRHCGSTSSGSAGMLSQRTNPSLQLPGRSAPCMDPVSIVPEDPHGHDAPAPKPAALRLVGDRVTIRNGTLTLPDDATLVLEGALALTNVTVRGASAGASTPLVFVAAAADVTMQGCSVGGNAAGHGVSVGERGLLTLASCDVSGNLAGGVVVSGRGAELTAAATAFDRNGENGAHIAGGALATFKRCTFSGNGAVALAASGASTRIIADACVGAQNGGGTMTHDGAALSVTDCDLERSGGANTSSRGESSAGEQVVAHGEAKPQTSIAPEQRQPYPASSSVYATPDNSSPFSSSAGASGSGSVAKLVPSAKHDKFVDATSASRGMSNSINHSAADHKSATVVFGGGGTDRVCVRRARLAHNSAPSVEMRDLASKIEMRDLASRCVSAAACIL